MRLRRREVLKLSAGFCLAGCSVLGGKGSGKKEGKACKGRIGIQLYAVRGLFSKDPAGTLKSIAALGYQGVEFWGYGGGPVVFKGKTASEFRRILDGVGLKCCGMHMSLGALQGEKFKQTVEVNKILGNKFLIVAAARKQMSSPEAIRGYAKTLSELAARAEPFGMKVGYHCHSFDMTKCDGKSGWELLFAQASPKVVMQLDVGNCGGGGGDPVAILKEFPGRAKTVHVKEYKAAPLVAGNAVWQQIIEICRTLHGTEWYIVEQGERGGNSLKPAEQAIKVLHAMGL